MARQHRLDTHFGGAQHYRIEILHLEPEQNAIAVGSVGAIADGAMMMLDIKTVQLQDELTILHQLLILPAAVSSAAAQQALIPLAAGFDIRNTDQRLWTHGSKLTELLTLATDIRKPSSAMFTQKRLHAINNHGVHVTSLIRISF